MKNKRGSMLITILGILVVLCIFGLFFGRYMSSIRGQANRMGEIRLSELAAQSVAILSVHKLQFDMLGENPSDGGALKKLLSGEASKCSLKETALDFSKGEAAFLPVYNAVVQPLEETHGKANFEVFYSLKPADFTSDGTSDKREKSGFIRLRIKTALKHLEDEFSFVCPIKITSAHIDFLSKFNLFINDVATKKRPDVIKNDTRKYDETKWRFNLVKNTPDGDVKPDSPKPIVLHNGANLTGGALEEVKNYLTSPIGWVFFGSRDRSKPMPVILNLSRGSNELGEFFHFYANSTTENNGMGFFPTAYIDHIAGLGRAVLLQWDIGAADEKGEDTWYGYVDQLIDAPKMDKSSIFRLYGTNGDRTPTLVLGRVYRGAISAKAYKTTNDALFGSAFFEWVKKNEWPTYISYEASEASEGGNACIATMARDFLNLDDSAWAMYRGEAIGLDELEEVKKLSELNIQPGGYPSQITQIGYNASIAYISTGNGIYDPFTVYSTKEWLKEVMSANAEIPQMTQVPVEFGGVAKGGNIPQLSDLTQKAKTKCFITIKASEIDKLGDPPTILEILMSKGLVNKNMDELALNGWVYIEGRSSYTYNFGRSFTLKGNGGIILSAGNISIDEQITSENAAEDDNGKTPKYTLQLVAENGDIRINTLKTDAVIVAGQKALISNKISSPEIRGAFATGEFDISNASAGADIFYNRNLAIDAAEKDNQKLLGYRLDPTPIYIK